MTGYGRRVVDLDRTGTAARLAVEIRSVNHRSFDLKIRLDEPDVFCESEIARLVRASIERGTVSVSVRAEQPSGGTLDLNRIRQTYDALERFRREAGMATPVDLATVAAFLATVASTENPLHGEEMWRVLHPAVQRAVVDLLETRSREGLVLRADLTARADRLSMLADRVATAVEPIPARFGRRLADRLAGLREMPGFDPGRVAQEIALMADRLDVSEELLRLKTHLDHFRVLLDSDVAVGRKLDFVIQEMGREINTIGSKAQDAAVAGEVIEAKAELEKIREQAQNIE
jgi:uncharacterized protein (TIGR00255 family)